MTWKTFVNPVLSLAGAVLIFVAGSNFAGMQVEGADVGPITYLVYVALPGLGSAVLAGARAIRRYAPSRPATPIDHVKSQCQELGAYFAGQGDTKGLGLLAELAEYSAKGAK